MNFNGKNNPDSGLTLEQEEIIRKRIAENYYDRDDVLLEVAKRILESQDLGNLAGNHQSNA